ncbi:MAG: penicillin-binding protein 2 [Proteobacteria bacterium]|nr:penicillin-binding protein 2 [Pseudomonadota bacterium]
MTLPGARMQLRNARADAETFRTRAIVGFLVIVLCLAALVSRYVFLQIYRGAEFAQSSDQQRISVRSVAPSRGLIFDRNGVLLADNIAAFRLEVVPEAVAGGPKGLDKLLAELGDVVAISADDIERFKVARAKKKAFESVPLRLKLSEDEIARFAVDRWRFPGVEVVPYLTRAYPLRSLFAHTVGYVGRIDMNELVKLDANDYAGTTHIGKTGVERWYEDELHGTPGSETVEVDVGGRVRKQLDRVAPISGKNLYLSIDSRLQRAAEEALGGRLGAAVAIDPRNGEVLAMVSEPDFDGNLFVNGIGQADYTQLTQDPRKPLLNRAIAGGFIPGSTIKPYAAAAGLELGVRTPSDTVVSTGEYHIPGQARGYRDDFPAGRVDLKLALAWSVNTYFYSLAYEMGIDRFSGFLGKFGFGAKTGIDVAGELPGVLPSAEWLRATRNQPWYAGYTVNVGFGQGFWVVTPIQLAHALTVIAAKGANRPPHVLRATQSGMGAPVQPAPLPMPGPSVGKRADTWKAIEEGMWLAVNGPPPSTVSGLGKDFPYAIAGKTGTAERYSRYDETWTSIATSSAERHQVLFECFTPAEEPRIAVVVALEAGKSGASDAAPVARKILDAWLKYDDDAPATPARVAQQ